MFSLITFNCNLTCYQSYCSLNFKEKHWKWKKKNFPLKPIYDVVFFYQKPADFVIVIIIYSRGLMSLLAFVPLSN